MSTLFPLATFEQIQLDEANRYYAEWGHRMGPLLRGNQQGIHHALLQDGKPMAIASTSSLIHPWVGGGLRHMTRKNTRELSRLCAARPGLCRVVLRLWRELVFPQLGVEWAISYQDADIHTGNTYRFDGWKRLAYARGTPDLRSGRQGRNRYIWAWSKSA
jgi:hypothetical protein